MDYFFNSSTFKNLLLRHIAFFIVFCLGMNEISFAQLAKSDSIIQRALLKTSENASLLKNFKLHVLVSEKTRFTDILGLGEKRLEKIEGVREDQWYGHTTESDVYALKLNQSIHEIKRLELLNKKRQSLLCSFGQIFIKTSLALIVFPP